MIKLYISKHILILLFGLFISVFFPIIAYGLQSDDFNTCTIDTGLWTLVDPMGDAVVATDGAGTGDAQLFFSVPAGVSHDAWTVNDAPRLLQDVADSDFTVEIKYDSAVTQGYQSQGLIIEESSANWLRFDFYSNGSTTYIFAASFVNGSPNIKVNQMVSIGSSAYMQVERIGDDWTLSYSGDGLNWNAAVSFAHTMALSAIGPFVGNYGAGGSAPAHTAEIDYFFNALDPIEPEDGGAVPSESNLNVIVEGSGSVNVDPDQTTFYCEDEVTLTAVSDPGYRFSGWSGDLSGSDNPATITMNADKNITAIFDVDTDTTPPVISNVQVSTDLTSATITWTTDEPATSAVEYGETTIYEFGTVEDLSLKLDHSITLTNLNPDTLHHYKITSIDSYNNSTTTGDNTFTTQPDISGMVSDDFNQCSLNFGLWTLVDPLGDAIISTIGAGTGDAHLLFSVPAGIDHDVWTINNAPRLLQDVADTDFTVEIKYDSAVSQGQSQGLIIEENSANWLRFDFYSNSSGTYIFAASFVNGSPSIKANQSIAIGSPVYMQVERIGDDWTLSYSGDGTSWNPVVSFARTMAVSAVGPFVGNSGSGGSAPAHTAEIDYFFNAFNPIEPEDGGTVPSESTLNVSVEGAGVVNVVPDQTTYSCGEEVTLTAVPDAGYWFSGWSGDLSGSENPTTIAMNADKNITANFDLDTTGPVISNIEVVTTQTTATITWTTDEPATSAVEYGETTTYELGTEEDLNLKVDHSVTLTALNPETLHHYKITSEDASGFTTTSTDMTFVTAGQPPGAPLIDVWYGPDQSFGSIGNPQRWVNILGNVSDADGIANLKYSLNGGSEIGLEIGPYNDRLAENGDFNIEISFADLLDGQNQVLITARDNLGNEAIENVNINYESGNIWPDSYMIDWSSVSNIQDVAQIVDGHWSLEADSIRIVEPGYDRLIAIGDIGWTDYEVTVPITVHGIESSGNYPAVGLLTRWQGHVADGNQPSLQWWPLGVFGYYRWYPSTPKFELLAKNWEVIDNASYLNLEFGIRYIFKLRSETNSGDSQYRLKVWRAQDTEPTDWTLVGQELNDDQTQGSLMLVAHYVDASFGDVTITPVFQEKYVLNVNIVGSGFVDKVPDKPTYIYGDSVTLTATADLGWVFTGWSGDLSGSDNPTAIAMTGDRSITANFSEITQHPLDVIIVGNGTVSLDPDQLEYDLGQQVTLTAIADPDWVFTGWSGELSGLSNPAMLTITGDHQVTATFFESTLAYSEGFEGYSEGDDPVDWLDTRAFSSMVEDDSLFQVFDLAGSKVFGTESSSTDIHSHFTGSGISTLTAYEYTGRMMITAPNGGIGVTFFSQYPNTDAYYRLRRHNNKAFHIAPHGPSITGGVTDTGVVPATDVWYNFRVWVQDTGTRTEIRARVWEEGSAEPADWQVDCYDDSGSRLISGLFGMWSYKSGGKYWDDLMVKTIDIPRDESFLSTATSGNGSINVDPNEESYSFGQTITLTATADPGWVFTGWSGDLSGSDNPTTIVMTDDRSITANFSEITQYPLDVIIVGNGTVSLDPDQLEYDLGQQVTLTATADPDWVFTGWSGELSGLSNPAMLTITGDHQVTATFFESTLAYSEGFEGYSEGDDPVDWLDTGAFSSMVEDDSLFQVFDLAGSKVFGTESSSTDIHSHFTGSGISTLTAYEYTGRMMITAPNGGIGVTFFSQYPNTDAYYRLRRHNNKAFHIAPHGPSITGGVTDTGVVPATDVWYNFRVWVQDTGTRTEIRARVWEEGSAEPADWHVDCYDDSGSRLISGTFGMWSYKSGGKYWDDLMVISY